MSSIKKNLLFNILYQVLQVIVPLITAPYISRVLGSEAIGTYAYTASISNYFVLFALLGIVNYGNRSIALKQDNPSREKVFNEIYTFQVISSSLSIIVYILFCSLSGYDNKYMLYIQILYVLSSLFDINWLYWGMEEFSITVIRNTIIKVGTAISILLFVKTRRDLFKYAIIMTSSSLISQIILWINAKRYFSFKLCGLQSIKKHTKPILMLFIPIIAYSIYKLMDKIMLGNMSSMDQVGFYENAEKFVNIPVGFITAFGTVMMPRISSLISTNDDGTIDSYNTNSFKYFSIIIIAISFGLAGISNVLAPVFYGKKFIQSGIVMMILSFSLIFIMWSSVIRTQYLIPNKMDQPYVISTLIGAIVNLGINLVLIPTYKSTGAAIGTVAAEGAVFISQAIIINRRFDIMKYLRSTIRYFVYGGVMYIIIRAFASHQTINLTSLAWQIVIGGIIYIIFILLDLYLTKDPLLKRLLHD